MAAPASATFFASRRDNRRPPPRPRRPSLSPGQRDGRVSARGGAGPPAGRECVGPVVLALSSAQRGSVGTRPSPTYAPASSHSLAHVGASGEQV
jgi:hypothetical protein